MALNLSRSTKLYVSTVTAGHSAANTFEIPVLDGYSFSQDAATQEVTLSEAGATPNRGKKIFNTALNPAALSITTYIKPYFSTTHNAVESILWEALVGAGPVGENTKSGASYFEADFENSNKHELLTLNFYFELENTVYLVKDVTLNTAEIDFSIDGIASIAWSGQGVSVEESTAPATFLAAPSNASFIKNKLSTMSLTNSATTASAVWTVDFGAVLDGTVVHDLVDATTYVADITVDGGAAQTLSIDPAAEGLTGGTVADVIVEMNNQLDGATIELVGGDLLVTSSTSGATSSILITDGPVNLLFATLETGTFVSIGTETIAGSGTPKAFNIAITGGSMTIDNGITFLTPEELGKVNVPIGSFTGARNISGNVTCYLNTGANNSGGLLSDLVSATSTITQEFEMLLKVGGDAAPRVEYEMNHAHLVIPAVVTEDVISLDIGFSALGQSIDQTDELLVRYYSLGV